jgi:RluA family pseudouridine synthase
MSTKLSLLYEDASILAIDKPAGLLTIPDRYIKNEPNLKDLATERFGQVRVVHRIDKETSGVVILARTEAAHEHLNEQFETRAVEKVYFALSKGNAVADDYYIDRPLRLDADRLHRTVIDAYTGKESVTRVKVLERFRGYVWLECRPETGRTHQIRVHLSGEALPIVADALYGDGHGFFLSEIKKKYKLALDTEEQPILGRLGLHAASVRFEHPETGVEMFIESPLPKDLRASLQQLQKHAPHTPLRW